MESDLFPTHEGFNGINLANYFLNQRSYNCVEFVHKRFLTNPKDANQETRSKVKIRPGKNKESKSNKHDKCQQCDRITIDQAFHKRTDSNMKSKKVSMLNHTIRSAKNLVPLVIPPGNSQTPIFYTIKTNKRKDKACESTIEPNTTFEKAKPKKFREYFNKEKIIESVNIKESVSHSSRIEENTLDEINTNESMSCTISEISEKRYHKREKGHVKNSNNKKYVISNSFEALATETMNTIDCTKLKIHLMNEKDKDVFRENLQIPIINAIKECISELSNQNNINDELKTVQKIIKSNSEKLEYIINKVGSIEKHFDHKAHKTITVIKSPELAKSSTLEQLSQDLIITEKGSSEEDFKEESARRNIKVRGKSIVVALQKDEDQNESSVSREDLQSLRNNFSTQLGMKPGRPNRIPARYCWSDAAAKKLVIE